MEAVETGRVAMARFVSVASGRQQGVRWEVPDPVAAVDRSGELVAVLERRGDLYHPTLVFAESA